VNDDLRRLLHDAADSTWDDDVRASAALYAGQRLRRRRQLRGATVATVLCTAITGTVLVLKAPTPTSAVLVLGCTEDLASQGNRTVDGSLSGTSIEVSNSTGGVAEVVANGTSALALPGRSVVTLPLTPGLNTVRCGSGEAVRVRVSDPKAGACRNAPVGTDSDIQSGDLDQLTRARIGAVSPASAMVDSGGGNGPLRRVQLRSHDAVVAEALWHELPGGAAWQLQSLTRCSASGQ